MFLQALGDTWTTRTSGSELDRMYAWARASLLHYARWMAEHEYPYLDKPEILEFPTETWAAQDIRKSDVFHYAERYAPTSGGARAIPGARRVLLRVLDRHAAGGADANACPPGDRPPDLRTAACLVRAPSRSPEPAPRRLPRTDVRSTVPFRASEDASSPTRQAAGRACRAGGRVSLDCRPVAVSGAVGALA